MPHLLLAAALLLTALPWAGAYAQPSRRFCDGSIRVDASLQPGNPARYDLVFAYTGASPDRRPTVTVTLDIPSDMSPDITVQRVPVFSIGRGERRQWRAATESLPPDRRTPSIPAADLLNFVTIGCAG